jgi:hypothetical protein
LVEGPGPELLEDEVDLPEDQQIDERNDVEEPARDRRAHDGAHRGKGGVGVEDHPRDCHEGDDHPDDDRGVAQGEPGSHRIRSLPLLQELPRRVVDGADVVGIDRVTEAERVAEDPEGDEDPVGPADHEDRDQTEDGGSDRGSVDERYPASLPRREHHGVRGRVAAGSRYARKWHAEVTRAELYEVCRFCKR